MSQKLIFNLQGLCTYPNNISQAPQGSLTSCNNVVLNKQALIESRRGFFQYGNQLTVGIGQIDKLVSYRNNLIVHYNGTLALDTNGSGDWVPYTGTFNPPGTAKIRTVESNQNLYFTTGTGLVKLDHPTGTIVQAGAPPGLDGTATLNGTVGFLGTSSNCAYRVLWGYNDANNNEIVGAPSQRIILNNPNVNLTIASSSGTTVNVASTSGVISGMVLTGTYGTAGGTTSSLITSVVNGSQLHVTGTIAWTAGSATAGRSANANLTFTIPEQVINQSSSSWFYQVYRSVQTTPSSVPPGDELQLAYQGTATSAQLSAKQVTIVDTQTDSLLGAALYTNASQQGIDQENNQPPLAYDVCTYKGYTFYANCTTPNLLELTLTAVGGTAGIGYANDTGTLSIGGTTITGVGTTSNFHNGQLIVATGIPNNTFITAIGSTSLTISQAATVNGVEALAGYDFITIGTTNYYAGPTQSVANNTFAAVTTGDPALDITNAANSLVQVVNQSPTNNQYYGLYTSGYNDLPGQMEFQERGVGGSSFAAISNQGIAFNPALPTSGTSVISTNSATQNRLYFSKYQQPEAVPLLNYIDIGNADFPIVRILALREAVLILKGDGIYYLAGETIEQFDVESLDYTTTINGAETAVVFNNQVFVMTLQGIAAISASGVSIISQDIRGDLLTLSSDLYPNFAEIAFGVAYESEDTYLLYVPTETTDDYPTQCYVYNYATKAFTRWSTPATCGIVNVLDDKLYTGNPIIDYVYKERKDFATSDYADEQYTVSITGFSGYNVTLSSNATAVVGQALQQNTTTANVTAVSNDGVTITLDQALSWSNGSATLYNPILNQISFNPCHCDSPGNVKQFREITFAFENANFSQIQYGFTTEFNTILNLYDLGAFTFSSWGNFPWGEQPWGGGYGGQQTLRTFIDMPNKRAHWLNVNLQNNQCFTELSLLGFSLEYNVATTRQF